MEENAGYDFREFSLEGLGRFRKFAKLKIVLKVENRSCGRFLFWGAFVCSRVGFLSVCACVLWVKIGFVFLALVWCGFWGLWCSVGDSEEEIVLFLS